MSFGGRGDGEGQVSICWPKAYQSLCDGVHQRFGECEGPELGLDAQNRLHLIDKGRVIAKLSLILHLSPSSPLAK